MSNLVLAGSSSDEGTGGTERRFWIHLAHSAKPVLDRKPIALANPADAGTMHLTCLHPSLKFRP